MHTSWGAYEVNVIATIASFLFVLIWFVAWQRTRHGYMLMLAVGWLGLAFYWGLVAISAGEQPVLKRADILVPIRLILLASIAFMVAGKLAMLHTAYKFRDVIGVGGGYRLDT